MRRRFVWLPLVVLGSVAARGPAQQAVQLPTVSSFGTRTTVTVPDRGSVYLGGVNRAASGRNEFGVPFLKFPPFRNRGIGMERSAASMWVSVYIHDFDAMDAYLLSQPTRRYPPGLTSRSGQPGSSRVVRRGPVVRRPAAGPAQATPAMSVAELRARHVRQEQARAQEAEEFFQRGKRAEQAGKLNVARIYYQMASRRATGELKSQVAARLELVTGMKVAHDK